MTSEKLKVTPVLVIVAVLWIIWGLVHVMAGFIILGNDTAGAVQAVADAIDPAQLDVHYPAAAGALIKQHGFNLLWIGVTTTVGGVFIFRGSIIAVWLSALVGGLADVGYFVFIDLGGFANFVPGSVMTIVSGSAILLSIPTFITAVGRGR